MTEPDATSPDPAEAITAALSRLRGRRGPRPPWDSPGFGGSDGEKRERPGPPWGPGGGHGRGGPFGGPGGHGGHPGRGHGPWAEAMQARFGAAAGFRLLEALAAASAPLSVSELAQLISVDQPRASRLVQSAVQAGHVRREADPDDARRTNLVITDAGRSHLDIVHGQRRSTVESALAGFSPEEQAQLASLLTRLAAAWPQA